MNANDLSPDQHWPLPSNHVLLVGSNWRPWPSAFLAAAAGFLDVLVTCFDDHAGPATRGVALARRAIDRRDRVEVEPEATPAASFGGGDEGGGGGGDRRGCQVRGEGLVHRTVLSGLGVLPSGWIVAEVVRPLLPRGTRRRIFRFLFSGSGGCVKAEVGTRSRALAEIACMPWRRCRRASQSAPPSGGAAGRRCRSDSWHRARSCPPSPLRLRCKYQAASRSA